MVGLLLLVATAGVPMGDAVEGWPVPPGTRVEVDALAATIRLTMPRALAGSVKSAPPPSPIDSTFCRRESQIGKGLVMRCDSRRLSAEVLTARGRTQVVVRKLRAPPMVDGESTLPLVTWDPREVGLGGECPGDTPASRAECLLQRGDLVGAVAPLREAVSQSPGYARLRLGDLAMLAGDPERAALLWDRTQGIGPFGRLAAARLCELLGQCERSAAAEAGIRFDPLDHAALPEVIADEVVLRRARFHAYDGRFDSAVESLLGADMRPCRRAVAFCQRLLLEAFRVGGADDSIAELAAWLALPTRGGTSSSAELSEHAAVAARSVGAAGFAAALWSHAIDGKRGPVLEDGMLKISSLYLDAGETARAATVLHYAGKTFPRSRRQAHWDELHRRLLELEEVRGEP